MPRIQIAQLSPFAGIGKASGKPYNMLRVKAIITSEDGEVALGELAFFEHSNRPIPKLTVGHIYEPVVSFESDKGNLIPRLVDLKPIAVNTVSKVA